MFKKQDGQLMLIDVELTGKEGPVTFKLGFWPPLEDNKFLGKMDLIMVGVMQECFEGTVLRRNY